MTIYIEKELSLKTLDYLLLQHIAEMKLDRNLNNSNPDSKISFIQSYKNAESEVIIRENFKVAVGAVASLDQSKVQANEQKYDNANFDGGAGSYTKITNQQADYFLNNYDILDYYGDDESGFGAIVYKNKNTNEVIISFRSTEYSEDFIRDSQTDQEIAGIGTAIGQNISMTKYIERLKIDGILVPNQDISITGFSLGGHLGANFYKMYENEFSIQSFMAFNAPGVGKLTSPTNSANPYVELKNELLSYSSVINIFKDVQEKISLGVISSSGMLLNNINEYIFLNNEYSQDLKDKFSNILNHLVNNMDQAGVIDIVTNYDFSKVNIGESNEEEKSKNDHINDGKLNNALENSIFSQKIYLIYKDYIEKKYNANPVTNTIESGINGILGDKTGLLASEGFYGDNVFFISGIASRNANAQRNDYNFVANSNIYTNPIDIIIEDRVEIEEFGGRLPVGSEVTKDNLGSFANTHSLFLLNKSLTLMGFLAEIEGEDSINVKKYSSIISSATAEKATLLGSAASISNGASESQLGDANSIGFIINTLYKMIVPSKEYSNDILFENTLSDWGNNDKFNQLQERMNEIKNNLISPINIISLYSIENNDIGVYSDTDYILLDKNIFFDKIFNNSNTNESNAYKYALEKMNPFIVMGLDYSSNEKLINYDRSEEWVKTRIDILTGVVQNNIRNSGDYLADFNVLVDDDYQGLRFTNITEKYTVNNKKEYDISTLDLYSRPDTASHRFTPYNQYYSFFSSQLHYSGNFELTYEPKIVNGQTIDSLIISVPGMINGFLDQRNYEIDKKNSYKFGSDIYFLNEMVMDFESNSYLANEKVFLNPNKTKIFNQLQEYGFYNPNPSNPARDGKMYNIKDNGEITYTIENYHPVSTINLEDGNDYLEVETEYAVISGNYGKKTYYITNTRQTIIEDKFKLGSITFNGVLLDGGEKISEILREQTVIKDGVEKVFRYEIKNTSQLSGIANKYLGGAKTLVITDTLTNEEIIIKDFPNFGEGIAFGFKGADLIDIITENQTQINNFINELAPTLIEKVIDIKNIYFSTQEFESDLNITIDIQEEDAVFSKMDNGSLVIYDRENTEKYYVINDFFDSQGLFKYKDSTLQYVDNMGNIQHKTIAAQPNLNIYSDIRKNTLLITPSLADFYTIDEIVIDYKLEDKYNLVTDTFYQFNANKIGNDLIFSLNQNDNDKRVVIKNYFAFDHSTHTNFYISEKINDVFVEREFSISELSPYLIQGLGDGDDLYQMNSVDNIFSVNGGYGNDKIIGTINNETFISNGVLYNNNQPHDGNDIFTGGGGSDVFIFSAQFGKDIITDLSNDDLIKINIPNNFLKYERVNNNLIILDNINNHSITVENYFINIDYKNSSKIITYENSYGGENPMYVIFTPAQISTFDTLDLKEQNYTQKAGEYGNVAGNYLDNELVIKYSNTKVNGGNNKYINNSDGDDTIIIDIDEEESDSNSAMFRTEINFQLKGGNDTVKNGLFKKEGEYGDIIVINNIIKYNVAYSKIFEQGSLKGVRVTLEDGSSMLIQLKGDEDPDSILLKVGSEYVKISDLDSLMFKINSYGSDENDNVNVSTSYKGYNIKTYGGDDNITGSQGDDIIEGGKGMDTFYATSGNDTYIFNKGDGIDKFRFKGIREKLSLTFIIDNQYDPSKIKYSFSPDSKNFYLSFSQSEGVIFEGSDWSDLIFLRDGLTLKNQNGDIITIPDEVSMVTGPVFTPEEQTGPGGNPGNPGYVTLNGTFGNDTINLQDNITNFVNALDGDDVIYDGTGNDFVTAGRGNDTIYLKDGLDQFNFNFGDGIDTYHLNPNATHFSITFNVSSMFSSSDMKYYYDSNNQKVYLTFSQNEGIIFENVDWQTFSSINDKIKIRYFGEMNDIAISNQVTYVTETPFVIPDPVEVLEGTNGDDVLEAQNYQLFSVVYAKDGNDSITDYRGDSVVVAGKGNDNIFMGFYTTAIFKEGDGQDMVYANYVPYNLSIMRDASRVVNGENTLFEVSLGGTADLKIKYGSDVNSSDSITIKNYFDRSVGQTFSIYEDDANKTTIYDLRSILQSLNINKQSLATMGTYNVKNSDVSGQEHLDKMVAGEIAYQYFNNSQYADKQGTANIIESMSSGMLVQEKIRT